MEIAKRKPPVSCPLRSGPVIILEQGSRKRGKRMARRIYTPERIISNFREAEVLLRQGSTVGEAARKRE